MLGSIHGVNGATDDTKVGIGVTAPLATFHVVSYSTSATSNTADFQAPNIGPNQSHIHRGTNGDWYIRSAASAGKVILEDTGGNVGIGTGSPNAKLQVSGGDVAVTTQGSGIILRATTDIGGAGLLPLDGRRPRHTGYITCGLPLAPYSAHRKESFSISG